MTRSELLQTQTDVETPDLLFVDMEDLHWSEPPSSDVIGAVIVDSNHSFSTCIAQAAWTPTRFNVSTGSVQSQDDVFTMMPYTANISASWARFLNPVTDNSGNTVFKSLASLFNGDRGDPADQVFNQADITSAYERILAALIANGLASAGIDSTLQGNLSNPAVCAIHIQGSDTVCNRSKSYSSDSSYFHEPPEAKSQDWYRWEVKHSVQGLAYSTESGIIIFYVVVLVIYAMVVTVYSFWILWRGQSSSPWRSVSELTTLALNSPQPAQDLVELDSTSAGIFGLGAFEKNVRVVAVDDEKLVEEGTEELQLVFGKEMPRGYKKLVLDDEYGATR